VNIPLTPKQQEQCEIFTSLLLEWNRTHNLTGATTPKEIEALIFDSLYPLEFLKGSYRHVLDIGSGAGFPAIPLAIMLPEVQFTLVEPLKKRIAFLNFVAIKAGLKNLTLIPERIEAVPTQSFDLITSKAVAKADLLYELANRFMDTQSEMLLYKGRQTDQETHSLHHIRVIDEAHSRYLIIHKEP